MVPLLMGIMCSARHAELSSIQLRSVIHLNTSWHCTRKSLGNDKRVQGSRSGYETHFSILTNSRFEADCSSKDPHNLSNDEPTLSVDYYMDLDNIMMEYNSNDMFGDLLWVTYHRYLCY
jgi:hypothetical protein